MGYINGMNRDQILLFPESVDEYIEANNPVRFIDAYGDSLQLTALGFTHAGPKDTGRPGYTPADRLKLSMYGYLHTIRSSRTWEPETHRNVELLWWLRPLTPDFKTIADVRKDNGAALRQVCQEFTLLGKQLDVFGRELMAIDGSQLKAVNSKDRHCSEPKLKQWLKHMHDQIEMSLKALDQQDGLESSGKPLTVDELQEQITQLQSRRQRYADLPQQLVASGGSQLAWTDPASRSMKPKQGTDVCDHVQVAIDHTHTLIVEHDVTHDVTDQNPLAAMAIRAKATLEAEPLDSLADMGDYHGEEVKKCWDAGIVPSIPKPNTSANSPWGLFGTADFTSHPHQDCYACPAGQVFTCRFETVEHARQIRYDSPSACQGCPLKAPCTRHKENRRITRWVHERRLEDMPQRVEMNPEKVNVRKSLVEHPCGTMQRWMDQGSFLTRRLKNVQGDMRLTILLYHVKRVINIIGVKDWIAAVG